MFQLRLVEINEVPIEKRDEFKRRHKHFNTNNLWINLRALKRTMDAGEAPERVIVTVCDKCFVALRLYSFR